METKIKSDTFGDTFLGFCIGLILLFLAFYGEPDIVDAVRELFLKWAGLS